MTIEECSVRCNIVGFENGEIGPREFGWPLESRKGREIDSLSRPHLALSPVRSISDF